IPEGRAGTGKRPLPLWHRVFLAAGLIAIGCSHIMTIGYVKLANPDEAYAAAIGERLLEGYRLYDGAVSQRGPLMYYVFELIAKLFGRAKLLAIRFFALAFALASLATTYWAARLLVSRRAAAIAYAIVAYALAFGVNSEDALALHGETILVPMVVGGIALGAL